MHPSSSALRLLRPSVPVLPARVAFILLVSLVVSFLAGSSAPTPLYPLLQTAWGFDAGTTTIVFGVYALSVLAALLGVGSLSDVVGRRPVLLVTTLVQAGVMGLYLRAHGVGDLILARIVQGLATGAAAGAVGAALLDLDRVAGTVANSISPMIGTATGAILGGVALTWLPDPTHTIFRVLVGVYLLQAVLLLWLPERPRPITSLLAALRPRFAVPAATRPALAIAVPMLVAAWSLAGLHGALGPALARRLSGSSSALLGGAPLAVLAAGGAVAVLRSRRQNAALQIRRGAIGLIVGMALTLLALPLGSIGVFLAGTAIAGAGFGLGFQGGMRSVLTVTAEDRRAGVLAVLYVVAYLAMGVPAMIAGIAARRIGLLCAVTWFALAVIALAVVAWVWMRARLDPSLQAAPAQAPRTAAPQVCAGAQRPTHAQACLACR